MVLPITMLAVASGFVAIGVLTPMFDGRPMSSTGIILGTIPPFAPVIMPTGDVAPSQALIAVALTLVTSGAATLVAARIY